MEPISLSRGLGGPILRLQSDERLARLAAAGNGRAFEVLVRRHRPGLVRAAGRILPGGEAEDAAQQALLNAQQALRRNGAPARFEPWLHRIAVNAALKQLQRTPDELPLDVDRVDGVEQPADRIERRERLQDTIGAIGALPERQRRALVLRELEGRSHTEIARDLGLSAGAVRQLIHRARTTVRSAATALTPYGLLLRLSTDPEASTRTAEIVAGGGAGAFAAKTVAAGLVAGGIATGVALVPEKDKPAKAADDNPAKVGSALAPAVEESTVSPSIDADDSSGPGGGRREEGRRDSSGPGSGEEVEKADSSGPGPGPGGGSDSSGPGGGGGGGSGSSGSGSSGSGTSGSGSSGSGSSGSGFSGSGFSGSGSSGSGGGPGPD
jgi:RNA polymerase sigma factor (sigma-70 family)